MTDPRPLMFMIVVIVCWICLLILTAKWEDR